MCVDLRNRHRAMPLKTVEFLVSVQDSDVEASETCRIYELIDSLRERGTQLGCK